MKIVFPSPKEKLDTIISRNTFYFQNFEFEEVSESRIASISQNIFILKNKIDAEGLNEDTLVHHIRGTENGIDAILTITGFSQESLHRMVSFVRVYEDDNLARLVNRSSWPREDFTNEWKIDKIKRFINENEAFAQGIVNLFFRGSTIEVIRKVLPLFEFKKLDINKLKLNIESLVDTIVRYKIKGSYTASSGRNPELLLRDILKSKNISYEIGTLENIERRMDFIIPSKGSPKICIECSYLTTTASGMGDKAETEKQVSRSFKKFYPGVLFVGFLDGIGWYVRRGDLQTMVEAYDIVFTFSTDELERFKVLLKEVFGV